MSFYFISFTFVYFDLLMTLYNIGLYVIRIGCDPSKKSFGQFSDSVSLKKEVSGSVSFLRENKFCHDFVLFS